MPTLTPQPSSNINLNDIGQDIIFVAPNILDNSLFTGISPAPFTPTPTGSLTPTPQITPSMTFSPTITPTRTPTVTVTQTPTLSVTPSLSPVPNSKYTVSYNLQPGANVWYVNASELAVLQGVCEQINIKIYYTYYGPSSIKSLTTDINALILFPGQDKSYWHNAQNVFGSPRDAFSYLSYLFATNTRITPTPSVSATISIQNYDTLEAAPTNTFGTTYVNGEYFDGFYGDYGVSIEGIDVYIGTWYE